MTEQQKKTNTSAHLFAEGYNEAAKVTRPNFLTPLQMFLVTHCQMERVGLVDCHGVLTRILLWI